MKKPIEVFLRQSYYSKLQDLTDSDRPIWFSKSKAFENFKSTINPALVNYTIIYDEFHGSIDKTFLAQEKHVEVIKCGNDSESFLKTIDIIKSRNFDDDQIIYFLEDDYLHRPGWSEVMLEGFALKPFYLTLYDMKIFTAKGFLCEIFLTPNTHWRAVPATTNTFACKYQTLLQDLKIHEKFSSPLFDKDTREFELSKYYEKFWELQKKKRLLISPMPGWSTHCEANHLSPVINWEKYNNY